MIAKKVIFDYNAFVETHLKNRNLAAIFHRVKIDNYISELLYDHDCVIVTDLGGFIANYKPAAINNALHVISPPSKKLAFNASLKNNDGLLANHIAQRTLLNYVDACEVIREYVKEASAGMKSGQKLKIDKVGVLYFDQEQRLQFLPDHHANYLIESFGLAPVHSPAIKRIPTELKPTEEKAVRQPFLPESKPKKEIKVFGWKVLEMIPAAAVLAILIMTPPVLKEFNTNLSTLLPFSRMNEYLEVIKGEHTDQSTFTVPSINPFEVPPATGIDTVTQTAPVSETVINSEPVSSNPEPPITAPAPVIKHTPEPVAEKVATPSQSITPAVSTDVVTVEVDKRTYFVIGGCFRSLQNAENFVSELKSKGLDASIIGQNNSGLYMVSLFSSGSFNNATDTLAGIKSAVVENAWIYKK